MVGPSGVLLLTGGAEQRWEMSARLVAPVLAAAALVSAAGPAAGADRDQLRPSRAAAPARFASVEYNQWYTQEAARMRYNWGPKQYRALQDLWFRESNWFFWATNPTSGAYGIPQALPASKMRSAGRDWKWNPETQIDWGMKYIKHRYGSPVQAWSFWQRHYWY